ncbi:MAG: UDP-N-acetyl glucosamine 2-epimerase, partial [Candidatus Thorarchaeota archaeon]
MTKDKMKICFVLGTRPEITKLYSVMNAAENHEKVTPVYVHTGQHYDYEMSQVFLEVLKLPEFHYFLNVKSGSHASQTAVLLVEIEKTLMKEQPDVVIVLGDTNTTMAGALAASKLQIPVAHVEAGCRSFDMEMPEEINRLVADAISSIFFAPSEVAVLNLL